MVHDFITPSHKDGQLYGGGQSSEAWSNIGCLLIRVCILTFTNWSLHSGEKTFIQTYSFIILWDVNRENLINSKNTGKNISRETWNRCTFDPWFRKSISKGSAHSFPPAQRWHDQTRRDKTFFLFSLKTACEVCVCVLLHVCNVLCFFISILRTRRAW